MALIQANGIQIFYEKKGPSSQIPFVFIAGLSRDHTIWSIILNEMQDISSLTFDNRGAGQSDQPKGPYTIELLADDLNALLEKLHIQKAYIVGHSMGGFIAQHFAAKHPEKVDFLFLSSTCAKIPPQAKHYLLQRLEFAKKHISIEQTMQYFLPLFASADFLTQEKFDQLLEAEKNYPFPQSQEALIAQIDACLHHNTEKLLSAIIAQTLVIAGDQDQIITPANSKELAAKIPYANYVLVKNAGHMLHLEKPQEFVNLLKTKGI